MYANVQPMRCVTREPFIQTDLCDQENTHHLMGSQLATSAQLANTRPMDNLPASNAKLADMPTHKELQ